MEGTPNVLRSNVIACSALFALAVVATASGAQTPEPIPAPVLQPSAAFVPYPPGVAIDVFLTQQVTSETAKVGDTFAFQTKSDTKLGDLDVPAGTPGHGRLAIVVPAQNGQNGQLSLQADSIDLPSEAIWVNIDPSVTPRGHYSKSKSRNVIIPLPIGIVPLHMQSALGDLVLDVGTVFRVVTIAPRRGPAPLLTAPPTPEPPPLPSTPEPAATPTP
jgi:hypothetical protein